eukprot:gene22880-30055_t
MNPKSRANIPEDRLEHLEAVLMSYFDVQQLTPELVEQAAKVEPRKPQAEWTSHADKVVGGLDPSAIEAFVRGWRSHFLETMKPQFLPPHWSVDSRVANSSAE